MPRIVTAWDLVANYGTGGNFQAKRKGGRVIWTDARLPRRDRDSDDVVIIGRVEPVEGGRLRVIERYMSADAEFELLWEDEQCKPPTRDEDD